ncbi:MAG: secretion protein HlyD [Acidobacteria bacterium]|nr:MAG: secretion protein HlyD [Acidobacteriota bacterium]
MKISKKLSIAIAGAALVGGTILFLILQSPTGVVEVQTGRVLKQDLRSVVTASGEIRPKTFVNVGANAFGKIVRLYVKEGDHVKAGQMLAQLENVQSVADVSAAKASLTAAEADYAAGLETLNTNIADLDRAKADLEQKRYDWGRAESLYKEQLISKKDYDASKNAYEAAVSALRMGKARIAQSKAAAEAYKRRIAVQKATLVHNNDVLSKTEYRAPFNGVVTNLPVREGETVVVGIQNSPGSTLMTLADTSVITAEVKVDETDIVNVKLGQSAEVSIDAIPKKKFRGIVTEIGNNALLRSTGVATSQSTGSTQEAKDFKVVVMLSDVPDNLRPGLSATAKIMTASKTGVLSIPIQALTIRQKGDLVQKRYTDKDALQAAEVPMDRKAAREELQGVFVIRSGKAQFVPVETGITGTTDVEVLEGLKEGDEIVTGNYKALRTMKPESRVKVNNSTPEKEEEKP